MQSAKKPRPANPRQVIIREAMNPESAKIIEVGALDNPTFPPADYDIKFIDYATKEQLLEQYSTNPRYTAERLVEVHYPISSPDYASQIHERFDLAIANHVIEHIPDTIRWIRSLGDILNPGGYIFLAVPDRRYTFDYLRPVSTIADLLRVYYNETKKPDLIQIFEHMYYWRPIKAADAWGGRIPELINQPRQNIVEAMGTARRQAVKEYVGVHCHVYTYDSFLVLFDELKQLDMLPFTIVHSRDVQQGQHEFHILLRKTE